MGMHIAEELDSDGFVVYWAEIPKEVVDKSNLSTYLTGISFDGDCLGIVPSYTSIKDPLIRLCHRLIAFSIDRRSQAPKKVTSTDLFYLRSIDVRSVHPLPSGILFEEICFREEVKSLDVWRAFCCMIDMDELVRFRIYDRLGDTWVWVAPGSEKQHEATTGVAQDYAMKDGKVRGGGPRITRKLRRVA
ncbi:hypothetical protein Tco_1497809 [Tanacetum coccineum]